MNLGVKEQRVDDKVARSEERGNLSRSQDGCIEYRWGSFLVTEDA